LSPAVEKLDSIKELSRTVDVPHEGPICDILWSDPDEHKNAWGPSPRGAGWVWGNDVSNKFLHDNDIKLIARAH